MQGEKGVMGQPGPLVKLAPQVLLDPQGVAGPQGPRASTSATTKLLTCFGATLSQSTEKR